MRRITLPALPPYYWAAFARPAGYAPMPAMKYPAGMTVASASACCCAAMAEWVVLHSVTGVAAAPAVVPPPLLGIAKERRTEAAEDNEDDEDEYCVPYLVRHMSSLETRTPGDTHPLCCWQAGADETSSSPRNTQKTHEVFTLIQAMRGHLA
jgi:hypothetical protein